MNKLEPEIRSRVWYIEARSCTDGDFASEDAASMGSGVLVEIEHREEPRKVRRYLLTCAHVIRRKRAGSGDWGGSLHDEILCWRPGQGYTRTYKDKRRCGEHPDIFRATVSPLSPCGGRSEELPNDLRDAPNDWILLDFDDPAFQKEGRPVGWSELEDDAEVYIVGYPGGAGMLKHAVGTRIWVNGSLVENLASGPFSQERTPEPGMLSLSGVDETRPGMSGGGIFDRRGALVGLHRAADDAAMQRNAIAVAFIRDVLDTQRNVWPTTPTATRVVDPWIWRVLAAVVIVALAAAGIWEMNRPRDCQLRVDVGMRSPDKQARVIDVTRDSGLTTSQVLTPGGAAALELVRMGAGEHWSFSVRFDNATSGKVDLIGCPLAKGEYELEEAHVILAPN